MDLGNIYSYIGSGGGILLILMTLVQIAPIQINPWSAIGRAIGRVLNGDVLHEIGDVKTTVKETQDRLDAHIRVDDKRDADFHRQRILQFSNELLRDIPHTKEDFMDILGHIDDYERYCAEHPEYRNNMATHAIKSIETTYDKRMEKHDFL